MEKQLRLVVANRVQKALVEMELMGQISDGYWENARPYDHWKIWSKVDVEVAADGETIGRNFWPHRDNYNFTAADLLEVVGDRMRVYATYAQLYPTFTNRVASWDLPETQEELDTLKKGYERFELLQGFLVAVEAQGIAIPAEVLTTTMQYKYHHDKYVRLVDLGWSDEMFKEMADCKITQAELVKELNEIKKAFRTLLPGTN